ncbi:MAG: SDR family oxidoreductase [Pirellulales bacterium]|nr:SDR family oxidoreductase [Pirellulales bacterium]
MKLEDKIALITGAGSGIGEAIAHLFAREGARLTVVDKSSEDVESTWKDLTNSGSDALRFCADITHADNVVDLVNQTVKRWGHIDVLVNNAGGPCANDLLDMEDEQWDRDIELNLTATARLTKAVLPHMVKQRSGAVVNIASVNGLAAYDLMAYGAAKAGVINLTKNLAVSYGKYGIRLNALCPGSVNTPAWAQRLREVPDTFSGAGQWYPLQRVGTADDIARAALFFASDDAAWITGQSLAVDGGLTAGNLHMIQNFMRT